MKTYKIITERLVIRCYDLMDVSKYMDAVKHSINEFEPWMLWVKSHPTDIDGNIEVVRRFRGNFDLDSDNKYAIFDKDNNFIGNIGVHHWNAGKSKGKEIGYWIDTRYAGKGYATEAVKALCKVLFEIEKFDKIIIKCKLENLSSIRIPEKLEFKVVPFSDSTKVLFRMMKGEYIETKLPNFNITAFDAIDRKLEPSGIKIDTEEPKKEHRKDSDLLKMRHYTLDKSRTYKKDK